MPRRTPKPLMRSCSWSKSNGRPAKRAMNNAVFVKMGMLLFLKERTATMRFRQQAGGCGLGDEVAGIQHFKGDGFVVLGKVNHDRTHLLGIINRSLGDFDKQNIDL